MKHGRYEDTNHESMPEIETIGDICKPSEEPIIHEESSESRIYQSVYGDRPESWYEWEPVGTHRIGVCEIRSSSDDPEIGEYSDYRSYENNIPDQIFA